jgi:Arc/MetJ family transcription regulator
MRTTLVIADDLVADAREASGLERISDLVREGLRALIAKEARVRLAAMGGSDPKAEAAPRQRLPASLPKKKGIR